jgi:integrase
MRFKKVMKTATKEGYYRHDPCEEVKSKINPSTALKENLEVEEYLALLKTPCVHEEVQEGFIFCCYTGLRFCDVDVLDWEHSKKDTLTTRIIQRKTGQPVVLTLHPIAKAILEKRRQRLEHIDPAANVFHLPTHAGSNIVLKKWVHDAGIQKKITWSCARLSFSILLQDKNVDDATVACLLGHTTTAQVRERYKRHRAKDQAATISNLPSPDTLPYFLQL